MIVPPGAVPAKLIPFSGRWTIAAYPGGLLCYTAEKREGTALRLIVAPSPAELAGKLAAAEGCAVLTKALARPQGEPQP